MCSSIILNSSIAGWLAAASHQRLRRAMLSRLLCSPRRILSSKAAYQPVIETPRGPGAARNAISKMWQRNTTIIR